MKTLSFTTSIHAPRKKVWRILWDDASYRKWTSAFSEGSHAISDWKEGSDVQFVGPNGDGMFSTIAKLIPEEMMSFKHLGTLKDGVPQQENDETQSWAGAMENYILKEKDGNTELAVSIDVTDDFENYFQETFPKALEKVKELSEASI
jgi:uncharacterized protein YndB with AHSA1/START domain